MVGTVLWLVGALTPPLIWFVVHFGGLVHDPVRIALLSGAGICGAAFLLSWATEVAQLDIPRALALVFLALVAVLPEYAVDLYFAWRAGQDPTYLPYATANMTGANRLLIGLGWAAPVMAAWWWHGDREVVLPREQAVEVNYLALATVYSFLLPIKGSISLIDSAVLLTLFGAYLRAAGKTHHEEPELEGPAAAIGDLPVWKRRFAVIGLFTLAAGTILAAAEPFAESLIETGKYLGIEEFLLVQWLAPLASESPEFIVAVLFAVRGAASAGVGTMISSKVNQWTLLVGALPIAYALSHGSFQSMHLDLRQREEMLLTSAQSVFAVIVISNFRFSVIEALILFGLFVPQFFLTSTLSRWVLSGMFLTLSLGWIIVNPSVRTGFFDLFRRRAHLRPPAHGS